MLKVFFWVILLVLIAAYVATGVLMVIRKLQSEAAVEESVRQEMEGKFCLWYFINIAVSVVVIWHLQPIVTPQHHGGWFILNAFVAWVCTTLSWGVRLYSTKLFIPLKIVSLILLYGSCESFAFAKVGVSMLVIILGVYFFWTHRELWTIAGVAIAVGAFSLLRALGVENAATIIWAVLKIGGVCFFTLCFFMSNKKGKVVCAIIVAILLAMLFGDVRSLYHMFVVMH